MRELLLTAGEGKGKLGKEKMKKRPKGQRALQAEEAVAAGLKIVEGLSAPADCCGLFFVLVAVNLVALFIQFCQLVQL